MNLSTTLDRASLWRIDTLQRVMPFIERDIPLVPEALQHIASELRSTCERRAVILYRALSWLLPPFLFVLYWFANCDKSVFVLIFVRPIVDGWLAPYIGTKPKRLGDSALTAQELVIFGIGLHVIQLIYLYHTVSILSSPYGFCSNIFLFLVTGFTSYSYWVTIVLCILKNAIISIISITQLPVLDTIHQEYISAYWCSCAIVLAVLTPVHLETIARIVAEREADSYKSHMHDLLRASFDATIWVDNDLRVVGDSDPRLDYVFLTPMCGNSLLDFVEDETERERFEAYAAKSMASRSTTLFHATFRTAAEEGCRNFDADVYMTSKYSLWLQAGQQHLIGLRLRDNRSEPGSPKQASAAHFLDGLSVQWECSECRCVNFDKADTCILCERSRDQLLGLVDRCSSTVGRSRHPASSTRSFIFDTIYEDEESEECGGEGALVNGPEELKGT
ncbi:hypothetical protein Pmar_PMAR002198 [Perkinsus marinus ATCC 50983]|uniref:RanBP2-type domain-containing protein n=1 Tax=Perkinsus marinus (strain ATCC 50983 / TXsc) TaxID=423536 RepID=C5L8X1_PERM5|nr:hypothetical protein Pmar_PMAR002198 [Perkinsus marinus ATCC 50983]EER06829.1 hypothetical protein Pmar_PMAR002198 [Perkinsus marinus ATCC 50983]|eukprot:XP_002775013.1 hypothetical protein Pmar_PMAR002198 [Perkinsus marinus ATCC 50983]